MKKSIKLKGGLFWDSTSLWRTLGEKPDITNGDLNDTKVMGTYFIPTANVASISNAPFESATALMVITFSDARRVLQQAISTEWQVKERWFDGISWTDWLIVPHIRTGSGTPSDSLGVDGDIYYKVG